VSLLRIINTPSRGIGASTVEALLEVAVAEGQPLWAALPKALLVAELNPAIVQRVEGFCRLIRDFQARVQQKSLVESIRDLLKVIDYKSELERLYPAAGEAEARWASIEDIVNGAAHYELRERSASLVGFLEEMTLADRDDSPDEDRPQNAVTLMTLHSAKGLEFPHVFLVGMEEGILPHQRSVLEGRGVEEERRLCYVGVTRAKESLTMTFTRARMKWGKPRPSIPSRFLAEMRGETERARRTAEASEALYKANQPETSTSTSQSAALELKETTRSSKTAKAAKVAKAHSAAKSNTASKRASAGKVSPAKPQK